MPARPFASFLAMPETGKQNIFVFLLFFFLVPGFLGPDLERPKSYQSFLPM
jgi:hypothetical protein